MRFLTRVLRLLAVAVLWCGIGAESFEICLSVIVRDEERVILRFLENNRFAFDHIDLVDTGSTDRTIELAQAYFAANNVSGTIHHFRWIDDFGKARSYALDASRRQHCEFVTFLDADEEVIWADSRELLASNSDLQRLKYLLRLNCRTVCQLTTFVPGNLQWWRFFAVNGSLDGVSWRGARHEYLTGPIDPIVNMPIFGVHARRDQSRLDRAPDALLKDVAALERDVQSGEDVPRSLYYIGQSYEQAGLRQQALDAYRRRVALADGWEQERFYSQLRVAS